MLHEKVDRWFVVFNPVANSGVALTWLDAIENCLKANHFDYELVLTSYPSHATKLVHDAIADGYRKIISVGGGGTCNEVANGILTQDHCNIMDVELAHIPTGTLNNWSNYYEIPIDYKQWIPQIKQLEARACDLGYVKYMVEDVEQKRFFISTIGIGFAGLVIHAVYDYFDSSYSKYKMMRTLVTTAFKFPRYKFSITNNGKTVSGNYITLQVALVDKIMGCKLIGHRVRKGSMILLRDRGDLSFFMFVTALITRFMVGTLSDSKEMVVEEIDAGNEVEITVVEEGKYPNHIQVDGELLGRGNLKVGVVKDAIRVRLPE